MEFLDTLIIGLSSGGIYALIALGYTMVYGIAKLLNFAHGDIIMVGAYTILVFMNMSGQPIIAIIAAIIVCILIGISVEKVAYKPLRGASPLAVLITAIGVSYFLQSLSQIFFGTNPKNVSFPEMGSTQLGALNIDNKTIITVLVCVVVMVALTIFIKYSKTGRAMIAVSEDRAAAQLMGISVNKIITITFLIGSGLAALAGAFMLLKGQGLLPSFGAMPGIKAFTAAVIGGIGSIPGAMIGGLLLGIVEAICNSEAVMHLIPGINNYTDAIVFAVLIIILLVKPTGILGKKRREKV